MEKEKKGRAIALLPIGVFSVSGLSRIKGSDDFGIATAFFYFSYFAAIYPFAVNASAQRTAPPAAPLTVL